MCDGVLSKVLQEGKKPKKVKKEKKPSAENAFCERPTLFESCFPLKTTQRTWGYNIKQTQCGAQPSSISHTSQAFTKIQGKISRCFFHGNLFADYV